jgi:osmotically-inducible protein OsmY
MTKLIAVAIAAGLSAPAAFAQTYTERITVYEAPRYDAFVVEESSALHSGAKTLPDTLLADDVAYALARDRKLDGITVTVSANNGQVMMSGSGDHEQSQRAQSIAQRVAGAGNVSGELSNTGG